MKEVIFDCEKITSLFSGLSSLEKVLITEKVTSVSENAFSGCKGVTHITIGKAVTSIGEKAFAGLNNLNEVICYAESVPTTDRTAFENSYIDYATLKVPVGSLEAYKTTAPWSGFKLIEATEGDLPDDAEKCATPTIIFANGTLTFSCETEDVEYKYTIESLDAKDGTGNNIKFASTYKVSVFAFKSGWKNSDTATEEIQIAGGKKGDVNGDNVVNAADMVTLVNIIMGEGSGGDNPPVSGDDSEVTSKISAYYAGGAINKINNTIQNGSQLLWGFKNGSSVSVTLIGAVLINGVTGTESNNLLSEPLEVAAGETKGLSTTIGVLGIQEPKMRFTYKYNEKEYFVEAVYKDIDGI